MRRAFDGLYGDFSSSTASDDETTTTVGAGSTPVKGKRARDGTRRRSAALKKDAPWQKMLDGSAKGLNTIQDPNSRDGKYFRRRFRLPHELFESLIKTMLDVRDPWFPIYGTTGEGPMDCTKNRGASLHVKVLSVLRVLGRGVTFDECFDGSGCSEEVIRGFFHTFVSIFCRKLFKQVIFPPHTAKTIAEAAAIYEYLGLGPAIGSTDCTHINLGNCPYKFKMLCTGKSGRPTLAYSLTCSHSRKIYHVTAGFYGSKNDKYISKFDEFISAVGREPMYTDFEWNLDVTAEATEERRGVFLICDGGYHKWRHMICGLKGTASHWFTLWSIQMESVRKDVECTFGILKCRFKILDYAVPYHGKTWGRYREKVDNVMWTCCILHNLCLKHDGLEFLWSDVWVCFCISLFACAFSFCITNVLDTHC